MEERLGAAGRQLANLDPSLQVGSVSVLSHITSFDPGERVCNTENMVSTERMKLGLVMSKCMGQGHEII